MWWQNDRGHMKRFIPSWLTFSFFEKINKLFKGGLASHIRRAQLLRLGGLGLVVFIFSYGVVTFIFKSHTPEKTEKLPERTPTLIETPTSHIKTDEAWRHQMENENKKLMEGIKSLESLFYQSLKDKEVSMQTTLQDMEVKLQQLESQVEEKSTNRTTNGFTGSPSSQLSDNGFSQAPYQMSKTNLAEGGNSIQKVTLSLRENPKHKLPKTVDTTIPAGAFAKTVLLSGLDASSAMNASSDPRPMLLRLIDFGTLPRRFQSDLKDCHCTASAYGDLSSERVYARLEKLTCITRKTGEIIETQVAGYIAGPDGKAGLRGVVASKDGQFLGRSLVGGIFSGLSNVANPQNRQPSYNPFVQGSKPPSPPNIGDTFTAGMTSGISTALDRLSQYYIDRAEQLQPVIQVAAGQVVDIVFTEGTFIGAQTVKDDLEAQRNTNQSSEVNAQN